MSINVTVEDRTGKNVDANSLAAIKRGLEKGFSREGVTGNIQVELRGLGGKQADPHGGRSRNTFAHKFELGIKGDERTFGTSFAVTRGSFESHLEYHMKDLASDLSAAYRSDITLCIKGGDVKEITALAKQIRSAGAYTESAGVKQGSGEYQKCIIVTPKEPQSPAR